MATFPRSRDKAIATQKAVEALVSRLRDELSRTDKPIDVQTFIARDFPHDIRTGQLLLKAFLAHRLRGWIVARSVHFEGYVSGIADNVRPDYSAINAA